MTNFIKTIKLVNSNGIDTTDLIEREIKLQQVASLYGFTPKIISTWIKDGEYHIEMEKIDTMCLADKYGDKPDDIPKHYWHQIKSIINLLFYREGIEYIDITPYNFIEKNDQIYLIDFGHAFYTSRLNKQNLIPSNWFLRDFLDQSKEIYGYNPDFE
jgi:tRNA A-37 threonylcarbamoyl transferase component Bud32